MNNNSKHLWLQEFDVIWALQFLWFVSSIMISSDVVEKLRAFVECFEDKRLVICMKTNKKQQWFPRKKQIPFNATKTIKNQNITIHEAGKCVFHELFARIYWSQKVKSRQLTFDFWMLLHFLKHLTSIFEIASDFFYLRNFSHHFDAPHFYYSRKRQLDKFPFQFFSCKKMKTSKALRWNKNKNTAYTVWAKLYYGSINILWSFGQLCVVRYIWHGIS